MQRGFLVFLLSLLCAAQLFSQEATIYGTITDPSGQGVPGVNFRINNYPGTRYNQF